MDFEDVGASLAEAEDVANLIRSRAWIRPTNYLAASPVASKLDNPHPQASAKNNRIKQSINATWESAAVLPTSSKIDQSQIIQMGEVLVGLEFGCPLL